MAKKKFYRLSFNQAVFAPIPSIPPGIGFVGPEAGPGFLFEDRQAFLQV